MWAVFQVSERRHEVLQHVSPSTPSLLAKVEEGAAHSKLVCDQAYCLVNFKHAS
jgi:hypothetical protein